MNGKQNKMSRPHIGGLVGLFSVFALILAACAQAPAASPTIAPTAVPPTTAPTVGPTEMPTVAPTSAPTAAVPATGGTASGPATVMVATDAKLGSILVDSKGMTLYGFKKDTADKSNCSAGCLKAWPPLLTQGAPVAGTGADASMLGTTAMADGSTIVTYNHMPLYYFAKDSKAGDTNGQGVGSVWFVVSPDGKMVENGASGTAPAGTAAPTAMAPSTGSTQAAEATVNVSSSAQYGSILVDQNGLSLYAFTKDTADKSNCSAGCMKLWPVLATQGSPKAGQGVDQSLLGVTTATDGTKMVTYNHMPLYYFAGDKNPGDTNGQNVSNIWFLVSPDGKMITTAPGSSQNNSGGSSGGNSGGGGYGGYGNGGG